MEEELKVGLQIIRSDDNDPKATLIRRTHSDVVNLALNPFNRVYIRCENEDNDNCHHCKFQNTTGDVYVIIIKTNENIRKLYNGAYRPAIFHGLSELQRLVRHNNINTCEYTFYYRHGVLTSIDSKQYIFQWLNWKPAKKLLEPYDPFRPEDNKNSGENKGGKNNKKDDNDGERGGENNDKNDEENDGERDEEIDEDEDSDHEDNDEDGDDNNE